MKANKTFIDGTTVCPACNSTMAVFNYKTNAVSNVSTKTNWEQWKKTTSWTETTRATGGGTMCLPCYQKRKLSFWLIFGAIVLMAILFIVIGLAASIKPLLYIGIAVAAVIAILLFSKSARELYDLVKMIERKTNVSKEFVCLLVNEHSNEFNKNDVVEASRAE